MGKQGLSFLADQARVRRRCISFAAGACGLVALGMLFEVADSVQMRFQDLWYGIRGSREPSPQVVIVAIDGRTLNAANERWPWRRDLYAPLVKRLDEAGARVITFEVAFSKATEEDEVYANRLRATCRAEDNALTDGEVNEATSSRTLSRRWAELIYRIYEVDPLICPRCGAGMKILTFIIDPKIIRKILDHLDHTARSRAPPS